MSLVLYYYPPTGRYRGGAGHVAIGFHQINPFNEQVMDELVVDVGGEKSPEFNLVLFGKPELYFLPPTLDSKDYYLPSDLRDEFGKGEQLRRQIATHSYSVVAYNCAHGAASFLNLLGFKIYPKAYIPALVKNIVKEHYSFAHLLKNIMDHPCAADDKRWKMIKDSLEPMSEEIESKGFLRWQSQVNWSEIADQLRQLRDQCHNHRGFFSTNCCFFQRKPPISYQKLDKLVEIAAKYESKQSLEAMMLKQKELNPTTPYYGPFR